MQLLTVNSGLKIIMVGLKVKKELKCSYFWLIAVDLINKFKRV